MVSKIQYGCQFELLFVLFLSMYTATPCVGQSNGDLRLNNDDSTLTTSSITEGRLEVFLDSEWGTVCDDNFTPIEANVACRQLGFSNAISYGVTGRLGFKDGQNDVLIHLDQVNCTDREDAIHLLSCVDDDAHEEHDCLHTEDVALKCNQIPLSDVDPYSGQLRVTGGQYPSEGLVEVYCNGEWGTICDDHFSIVEANTICAQLGYTHAIDFDHMTSLVGNESQSIWLDNVQCITRKQCLSSCQQCPSKEFHNCDHYEDVTIKCSYDFSLSAQERNAGITSCRINPSSSVSGETIAVIIVCIIFAILCSCLCVMCVLLVICLRKRHKSNTAGSEDSGSNATEMTRSTASAQPIPPPRPTDLPPLSTPLGFSPTAFSPFSPFGVASTNQPSLPPRPHNLPTPTNNQYGPLFSPFPMPPSQTTGIYESTPVYIAPDKPGRYIYINPMEAANQPALPPIPGGQGIVSTGGINHYEKTPTGLMVIKELVIPGDITAPVNDDSTDYYESIPPLVHADIASEKVSTAEPSMVVKNETDESKKIHCEKVSSSDDVPDVVDDCYDSLEPPQYKTLATDEHNVSDEPLPTAEKPNESNAAYVNIQEVQVEVTATPPYDSLQAIHESQPTSCSDDSNQPNPEEEPIKDESIKDDDTSAEQCDPTKETSGNIYCNVGRHNSSSS